MRTDTARCERRKNQMIQISPFTLDVLLVFDNPFTVLSFGRESPRAVHISELSITLTIFTAGNYTTRRKYYYLIRSSRPRKTYRGNPKDDCTIQRRVKTFCIARLDSRIEIASKVYLLNRLILWNLYTLDIYLQQNI